LLAQVDQQRIAPSHGQALRLGFVGGAEKIDRPCGGNVRERGFPHTD
jgi:hypothetical protein